MANKELLIPKLDLSSESSIEMEPLVVVSSSGSESEESAEIQIIKPIHKRKSNSTNNISTINTSYDYFKKYVDDNAEDSSCNSDQSKSDTEDDEDLKSQSTPDLRVVPKFNQDIVQKMNTYQLLLMYEKLKKQRKKGSQKQANQYLNYIIEKSRQEQLKIRDKEELIDNLEKKDDEIFWKRIHEKNILMERIEELEKIIQLKNNQTSRVTQEALLEIVSKRNIEEAHLQLIDILQRSVQDYTTEINRLSKINCNLKEENSSLKEENSSLQRELLKTAQELEQQKSSLNTSLKLEMEVENRFENSIKELKNYKQLNQEQDQRIKKLEFKLLQKEEKMVKIIEENKNLIQLTRKPQTKNKETTTNFKQKDKQIQTIIQEADIEYWIGKAEKLQVGSETSSMAIQTDDEQQTRQREFQLECDGSHTSLINSLITETQQEHSTTTSKVLQQHNNINLEDKICNLEKMLEETRSLIIGQNTKHLKYDNNAESDSALLIRIIDKDLSFEELQIIMNSHLLEEKIKYPIITRFSRNKEQLIIKTNTNTNTDKLLKILENIKELYERIELTFKDTQMVKLIITGIPLMADHGKILKEIKENYINSTINISKVIQRSGASTYNLVFEVDKNLSKTLLSIKYLHIGLNSCKVSIYKPIIRCANCQLYGHSIKNCKRQTICAYCSRGHSSDSCINKQNKTQHCCANCYGSDFKYNHPANSSKCTIYLQQLHYRNSNY